MKMSKNDQGLINITSKYFTGVSMTGFAKYFAQKSLKYSSGLNNFTGNHLFLKSAA